MNMVPHFTTSRELIAYEFSVLRMRALRERFWKKLFGTPSALTLFPANRGRLSPNRKLTGLKNIHVADIVGTLARNSDFDSQFRPLHKHSMDRWINAYILREKDGWPPILVHKIGRQYFVEDGHHRVSVARMIGMHFIEAQVWEHEAVIKHTDACHRAACPEKSPAKVYATS